MIVVLRVRLTACATGSAHSGWQARLLLHCSAVRRLSPSTASGNLKGGTVVYSLRDLTVTAAMSGDPRDRAVSGGHSNFKLKGDFKLVVAAGLNLKPEFAGIMMMVVVVRTSAPRAGSSTSFKVPVA
jgi:hypothetical protein